MILYWFKWLCWLFHHHHHHHLDLHAIINNYPISMFYTHRDTLTSRTIFGEVLTENKMCHIHSGVFSSGYIHARICTYKSHGTIPFEADFVSSVCRSRSEPGGIFWVCCWSELFWLKFSLEKIILFVQQSKTIWEKSELCVSNEFHSSDYNGGSCMVTAIHIAGWYASRGTAKE